jgi:hypothetical protein
MPKKCIICGEAAEFQIRDSSDYYCESCAQDNFGDLALLEKVEDKAHKLKMYMDDQEEQIEEKKIEDA